MQALLQNAHVIGEDMPPFKAVMSGQYEVIDAPFAERDISVFHCLPQAVKSCTGASSRKIASRHFIKRPGLLVFLMWKRCDISGARTA